MVNRRENKYINLINEENKKFFSSLASKGFKRNDLKKIGIQKSLISHYVNRGILVSLRNASKIYKLTGLVAFPYSEYALKRYKNAREKNTRKNNKKAEK